MIPEAVQAELKTETDFRGAKNICQAFEEGWLKVQAVENTYLAMELDYEEAGSIALALETQSQIILLDEYDGGIKARALGLQPIGVRSILSRTKKEGKIDSLRTRFESPQCEVEFLIAVIWYIILYNKPVRYSCSCCFRYIGTQPAIPSIVSGSNRSSQQKIGSTIKTDL